MNLAEERAAYALSPQPCSICSGPLPFLRWRYGKRTCGEQCATQLRTLVRETRRQKEQLESVLSAGNTVALGVNREKLCVLESALHGYLSVRATQFRCNKGSASAHLRAAVVVTQLLMDVEVLLRQV